MVTLAHPLALCALIVPIFVWLLKNVYAYALRVPFFDAVIPFFQDSKSKPRRPYLLYIVWSLLCLALASPKFIGPPTPLTQSNYNLMLVLDISPSMGIDDMVVHGVRITRLNAVKRAAVQFIQDRVGDQIGLILFGERPYLLTPLTYDHHSLQDRLDDMSVGLAGNSTSLGDALGLAIKRLQKVPAKGRVIVLLTDGVNNSGILSPLKAAEFASQEHIQVYTIGLGANAANFGGLLFNTNVDESLDEETLKNIAKTTGGKYFRATDLSSLQQIYKEINLMAKVDKDPTVFRAEINYYPWPLALALIFLIIILLKKI